jgi:hypothetical protein
MSVVVPPILAERYLHRDSHKDVDDDDDGVVMNRLSGVHLAYLSRRWRLAESLNLTVCHLIIFINRSIIAVTMGIGVH